jgi:hypothetical protein
VLAAKPESEMRIDLPVRVEHLGVGEPFWVPVGRAQRTVHAAAQGQWDAFDPGLGPDVPGREHSGGGESEQFLHCGLDPIGFGHETLPAATFLKQHFNAVDQQPGDRAVTRDQQQPRSRPGSGPSR